MLRKDKKGFTLTEIIATLAILGIILLIAIPGVGKLQENFKKNYYEQLDGSVLAAAKTYYKDNAQERPVNLLEASFLYYNTNEKDNLLIEKKYIDTINQYNKTEPCTGKVVAVKVQDDYKYANCRECAGKNYSEDISTTYDENICLFKEADSITKEYDINNGIKIYINHYNSSNLKNDLCVHEKVIRTNEGETQYLYVVENTENKICPTNVTGVNPNKIGVYKTSFKETKDVEVEVYQHAEPKLTEDNLNKIGNIYYAKGNIKIMLEDETTFGEEYHSEIAGYEYYDSSDTSWKGACSNVNSNSCSIEATDWDITTKFRVVGKYLDSSTAPPSIKTKKQLGGESEEYKIVSKKVEITFDKDGGTGGSDSSDVIIWKGYPIENGIVPPTKSGFKFKGYADNSGKYYFSSDGSPATADNILVDKLSLKAIWEEKIADFEIVVTDKDYNEINTLNVRTGDKYFNVLVSKDGKQAVDDNVTIIYKNADGLKTEPIKCVSGKSSDSEFYKGLSETNNSYNDKTHTRYYCSKVNYSTYGTYLAEATVQFEDSERQKQKEHQVMMYTLTYKNVSACTNLNGADGNTWNEHGNLCVPKSSGYTFKGWYTKTGGKGKQISGNEEITGDLSVYAHLIPDSIKVKFFKDAQSMDRDANGAPNIIQIEKTYTVSETTSQQTIPNPDWEKENYTLDRFVCRECSEIDGYESKFSRDFKPEQTVANKWISFLYSNDNDGIIRMYAKWTGDTYTLTYDNDGGSGCTSQTGNYGSTWGELCTPTRTGYTFNGWYTGKNGSGTNITANSKVEGDLTVYAKWTVKSVTVNFYKNDGTTTKTTQTYTVGVSNQKFPDAYSRTGYSNLGLALSATATSRTYNNGIAVIDSWISDQYDSGNTTINLYTVWTANTYTISYNANGGTGAPGNQTKTHDVSLKLSTTKPTRSGWDFLGWGSSTNASTTVNSPGGTYTNNSNYTFYAVWQPTCSLQLSGNQKAGTESKWYTGDVTITLIGASTADLSNYLVTTTSTPSYNSKINSGKQSSDTNEIIWYGHVKAPNGLTATCSKKVYKDTVAPTIDFPNDNQERIDETKYKHSAVIRYTDSGSGVYQPRKWNYDTDAWDTRYLNYNHCYNDDSPKCNESYGNRTLQKANEETPGWSMRTDWTCPRENLGDTSGNCENGNYVKAYKDGETLKWSYNTAKVYTYIRIRDNAGNWRYVRKVYNLTTSGDGMTYVSGEFEEITR